MTLPDRPKEVLRWGSHLPSEWLQEIGRIAIFAAWVEETLHEIYWRQVNLRVDAGSVITGDLSPNRLTEDIIKLASIIQKRKRRLSDLRSLITEYKALARQRNQCIHWTWTSVSEGTAHVSRPLYKGKEEVIPYTLDDLKALGDDFAWLRLRLSVHVNTDAHIRERRATLGDLAETFAPAPWLDKPLRPSPTPLENRATRKSRRRPRQADC